MMTNFSCGLGVGIILSIFIVFITWGIYVTKSKRLQAQDSALTKFYHSDSLWYRTSEREQIEFNYNGHAVSLWVQQHVFNGTNRNCKVHRIFINNKDCAIIIKIRDDYQNYFCAYVDEPFIEDGVWDILKSAHNHIDQQKSNKQDKESVYKERVLK